MGIALAAAGAAMITGLVAGSMKSIDSTVKTADKLGVQTESLLKLRYAADLAGVGNEQLDKSLQKFVLNTSDAAKGTGTAAAAYRELGLSAAELQAMAPEKAIGVIADKFNTMESQADKARLAVDIFGKEGTGMLNVLAGGSAGLDAAGAKLEKMGGVFSRLDAAKVEQANDSITDLSYLVKGAGQTLAIELAPYITAVTTKLFELGTSGEGMGAKVTNAFRWVLESVAALADWWELLKAGFYGLQAVVLGGLTVQLKLYDALGQTITWITNKITGNKDEWISFSKAVGDEAAAAADKAAAAYKRFEQGASSRAVKETFDEITGAANQSAAAVAAAAEKKVSNRGTSAAAQVQEESKELSAAVQKIQEEVENIGLTDLQIKVKGLEKLGLTGDMLERVTRQLTWLDLMAKQKSEDEARTKDLEKMREELANLGRSDREKALISFQGTDQLAEAASLLDQIDAKKKRIASDKSIEEEIEKLEQKVRTFGLSEKEAKVLELEAAGVSDEKIQRYLDAANKLEGLEQGKTATPRPSLVLAGSAEAQRLRWGGAQPDKPEDLQKKQLTTQERMAKGIDRMVETMTAGAGVSLQTVDIDE
jgi:hypothetical protein